MRRIDGKLPAGQHIVWLTHWLLCGICRRIPLQLRHFQEILRTADEQGRLIDSSSELPDDTREKIMKLLRQESDK